MNAPEHSCKCRFCDHDGPQVVRLVETGVHYAQVKCRLCGQFLKWLPKPDNDKSKYRRPPQHRDLVLAYGRGFCEMCLRKQADLPKGQTLEAQHVVEYQNGGTSDRENLWIICTACHKLVHWVRYWHGGDFELLTDGMLKKANDGLF